MVRYYQLILQWSHRSNHCWLFSNHTQDNNQGNNPPMMAAVRSTTNNNMSPVQVIKHKLPIIVSAIRQWGGPQPAETQRGCWQIHRNSFSVAKVFSWLLIEHYFWHPKKVQIIRIESQPFGSSETRKTTNCEILSIQKLFCWDHTAFLILLWHIQPASASWILFSLYCPNKLYTLLLHKH